MHSELENILEQTKQLDPQDKIKLISRLSNTNMSDSNSNPWLAIAGSLVDDPFFEDYVAEIDRYREEIDRKEIETEENHAA